VTFPGTAAATRQYRPTPPTTGVPEPDADADPIAACWQVQQDAANQYGAWRDSIPGNVSMDDLASTAGDYAAAAPAVGQLHSALKAAQGHAAGLAQNVTDKLTGQTVPPTADAQAVASRYFARVERQLDGLMGGELADAARQMLDDATTEQIPVWIEDVVPWLTRRGIPAETFTADIAAKIPGLQRDQGTARQATKRLAVLQNNHATLVRSMKADTSPPSLIDPTAVDASVYTNPVDL
jgi:hypothetical protein